MLLDNFRAKLRSYALQWRDAGIINDVQYQQITQHYLANLETTAKNPFIFVLIALGSILIVSGAIGFVAVNERVLPREIRVTLLLSLLVATNITGFYLWQQSIKAMLSGKKHRQRKLLLGQSLIILSALLLGVNLSIIVQMFHINQANYEWLLIWGIGVTFMAYSYGEEKLAILGLVIVLVGYLTGLSELPFLNNDVSWTLIIVEHMPLLLWIVFLPLAIWCKSRTSFTLTVIAFTLALQLNIKPLQYLNTTSNLSWLAAFAFVLPPALLWSYDDLLFPKVRKRYFQGVARNLALVCLCIFFYILGFHWHWQAPTSPLLSHAKPVNLTLAPTSLDIAFLSFIAVIQWLSMLQQKLSWNNLIILTGIITCGVAPFGNFLNIDIAGAQILLFNALSIIFALILIHHAFNTHERRVFWAGISMIILLVITRMLEYQTDFLPLRS